MRIRRMTEAAAKQRYPSEIDSLTDTKHLEIASKNGFWSRLFGGGQR